MCVGLCDVRKVMRRVDKVGMFVKWFPRSQTASLSDAFETMLKLPYHAANLHGRQLPSMPCGFGHGWGPVIISADAAPMSRGRVLRLCGKARAVRPALSTCLGSRNNGEGSQGRGTAQTSVLQKLVISAQTWQDVSGVGRLRGLSERCWGPSVAKAQVDAQRHEVAVFADELVLAQASVRSGACLQNQRGEGAVRQGLSAAHARSYAGLLGAQPKAQKLRHGAGGIRRAVGKAGQRLRHMLQTGNQEGQPHGANLAAFGRPRSRNQGGARTSLWLSQFHAWLCRGLAIAARLGHRLSRSSFEGWGGCSSGFDFNIAGRASTAALA